jgi:hypothetical protein
MLRRQGSGRKKRARGALAATLVLAGALASPAGAGAAAAVTEFTGGVTSGFSANGLNYGIAAAPDGRIWFTEERNPGRLGRLNSDGSVTEFTGGVTSGFSANGQPRGITAAPDGRIWFTEYANPGRVGRLNADGTVTEFTGGVTSGFSANGEPWGIAAAPDGRIWFTEEANPGRVGRLNANGTVTEFTGGVTSGFSANGFLPGVAAGPDGSIWFTEEEDPGRVGRLTDAPDVAPGGGPLPGSAAKPGPPAKASFAGSKSSITVDGKRGFKFGFRATPGLTGTAAFQSVDKLRTSRRRKLTLAKKSFTVPASGKVSLKLKLSKRAFRILVRKRKLRTRVTVTLRNAAGLTSEASKTIKLKTPKRKRGRR